MQQTFFICGFSPLYSGFLRSSSFLSSSSLCERLKIMKYDLFFSFSDLYPSVSPSWLSSVEKRASRLSLNPRLPEPRERIRLINSTSSSHFLTLRGDQQINSTSENRVNPSTTRKVDARYFKVFSYEMRIVTFPHSCSGRQCRLPSLGWKLLLMTTFITRFYRQLKHGRRHSIIPRHFQSSELLQIYPSSD